MNKRPRNLDEITRISLKIKKRISKSNCYRQEMQSLRGGRTFLLVTSYIRLAGTKIELIETTGNNYLPLAARWVSPTEEEIYKAIKSLERKAKCKLYYVLLISTDGEYL